MLLSPESFSSLDRSAAVGTHRTEGSHAEVCGGLRYPLRTLAQPMMRYGSIPGVGDRVSRLVLGSMVFSIHPEAFDNTSRLLDRFTKAGGTTVDTARIYAQGTSET